jgi:hypothetical protein
MKAQVVKEAASGKTLLAEVKAGASTSPVVVEKLEVLRASRALPLIWGRDNGPEFVSRDVDEYLARQKVVALRNVPTPQNTLYGPSAASES